MSNGRDDVLLRRTLALARCGAGRVEPNPQVGALLVRSGEIIAEGYHRAYGDLHAESEALREAGDRARGATLYCNLEPCSWHGPGKHQPPCTQRILEAGVRRVVLGQLDPNPHMRGAGVTALRRAGIEVEVADDPCVYWHHNRVFNTHMALARPFVHLKSAISLDGRIAAAGGSSRWITDEAARADAHRLRCSRDAVAVGIGTAIADDPLLNVRLPPEAVHRQPKAVVFDGTLRLSSDSRLVRERPDDVIVVCREEETRSRRRVELDRLGVTVLPVVTDHNAAGQDAHATSPEDTQRGGSVYIAGALNALWTLGIRSLLVEGGSALTTSFLADGLYDEVTFYIAPMIMGTGVPVVGDLGVATPAEAIGLEHIAWRSIGSQQVLDAMRRGWFDETLSVVRGDAATRGGEETTHVYRNR
ncbi:MAG: bifunctional diaminohydroxyphosphoribosylaminopyrimidine deaminase/5-amino-6-(5-phosphoribosylamino)uracil reductase RibD [Spirochaetales bacterium]|nr:bifunctional diaminohydroxyphosphoribosylaminopyrimidine deaminase/5-amino-6-(5-phosphoribosylamino)uracil reductase RibD [Spirochaetales bacterium]